MFYESDSGEIKMVDNRVNILITPAQIWSGCELSAKDVKISSASLSGTKQHLVVPEEVLTDSKWLLLNCTMVYLPLHTLTVSIQALILNTCTAPNKNPFYNFHQLQSLMSVCI